MCGIAGFVSRTGQPPDPSIVRKMVDSVEHRGPDGEGLLVEGRVALGHRRLAIIDLSPGGAQPMQSADGGHAIVYNGEIYNYIELRAELEGEGYQFKTRSDTEVILAAYDRWGPGCVRRFNGMWAFALLDSNRELLFCSRDRFGVKPLYYVDEGDFFALGSEIRQLLPLIGRRAGSRAALIDYLSFAADEQGHSTFFGGISRLAPGHNLLYRVRGGGYTIERYYRVERSEESANLSEADAATRLRELLTDSVRLRLRSDVRVGTCLSGGLDSSSIATLAASLSNASGKHRFTAITAASEDPTNDESAYARSVVEHAGLDWRHVRPNFADFNSTLHDVVLAQEEPFISPSVCMQFMVMQEAKKQGIRVLLDGQGGDETLLGYSRYLASAIREQYRHEGAGATLQAMRNVERSNGHQAVRSQLMTLAYFSMPSLRWARYRQRLHNPPWFPDLKQFREKYGQQPDSIFEMQQREIEAHSIPHLLRYEDKNSMWHSVETRLPFLDYRVVEFSLSLPTARKIGGGWSKLVLRQAMEGLLPPEVQWRKTKLGFEAPDSLWLPRLRKEMRSAASRSALLAELCATKSLSALLEGLPDAVLWRFYIASLWERQFDVTSLTGAPIIRRLAARPLNDRRTHQVCTRCVMDGSDPTITFDNEGVCSHCREFELQNRLVWFPNEEGAHRLERIVERIKKAGRDKPYDSLLGLSGGVDSSYLALQLHKWGLRPLVVHVDAGWNSELAVDNIERIVKHCGFDLHTHVVDWEDMRDLQLAYLRAAVANQDIPQDHIFFASLYHFAIERGIKTIFSGGNIATEGIYPATWEGNAMDGRNLQAIHRRFGQRRLKHYRTIGLFDYYVHYPFVRRMRTLRPLNYLPYNKVDAIAELHKTVGWRAYDRKHGESFFTKWFQNYYLPTRFGFDKRRPHLSSLIVSNQMTREEALETLERPLYQPEDLENDIEFLTKKLRISRAEFDELMAVPPRHHTEFPNWDGTVDSIQRWKSRYERVMGRPLRIYS
jgi:asparagine synthase (glutamine-hydrolysing)